MGAGEKIEVKDDFGDPREIGKGIESGGRYF